jgi:hypothetical protein
VARVAAIGRTRGSTWCCVSTDLGLTLFCLGSAEAGCELRGSRLTSSLTPVRLYAPIGATPLSTAALCLRARALSSPLQ